MTSIPVRSGRLPVEVHRDDSGATVRFSGDNVSLDDQTADNLRDWLADLARGLGRRRLTLDLANVRFVSSTLLGLLVGLNRQMRKASGGLALRNVDAAVYEVFDVTRLTTLFDVHRAAPGEMPPARPERV